MSKRVLDDGDDDDLLSEDEQGGGDGWRRLAKKVRPEDDDAVATSQDAAQTLEEGLFGRTEDSGVDEELPIDEELKDDGGDIVDDDVDNDEEEDDFIEYGEDERQLRRQRDVKMSAEAAEAREEADAIFGTDQELQELLNFTRTGGSQFDAGGGQEEEDEEDDDRDDDGFIVQDDEDENDDELNASSGKAEARASRRRVQKTSAVDRAEAALNQLYGERAKAALYQTKDDDAVRQTDVPERLQLVLAGRTKPHPQELKMEAKFIMEKLFPNGVAPSAAEEVAQNETKAFHQVIESVLLHMRQGEKMGGDAESGADGEEKPELRLELAFIIHFRKESCGNVPIPILRRIPELDIEYAHLQNTKAILLKAAQAKLRANEERLISTRAALRVASSEEEVEDIRVALQFFAEQSSFTEAASHAPSRRGLYYAARRGNASLLAEKFGLSVENLVANICGHEKIAVLDEALLPRECARDFIEMQQETSVADLGASSLGGHGPSALPRELRSVDGALAASREWYAHALSASIDLRRTARTHFRSVAGLSTEMTPKGLLEIDTAHPLRRVMELCGNVKHLSDLMPPLPPYDTRERHAEAVQRAELVLLCQKAREQGLVTQTLGVAEKSDTLLRQWRDQFTSLAPATDVTAAWNEQRQLTISRALLELLYPKLAKEAFEASVVAAHATLIEECALRIRELALAAPYRSVAAIDPPKKRKSKWVPNIGEWYERRARTVGACLVLDGEAGSRGKQTNAEVVLIAVDEDGEILDRMSCRSLLTNIRSRGVGGHTSSHDVQTKLKELTRLEEWFQDVRCEAIAVGACSLQCRRIREELDHVAFAMALRASGHSSADQMADLYHLTATPLSDTPLLHDFPALSRANIEENMPFRAVLVDETVPALWAKTAAAEAEAAEVSLSLRTALASARYLQDPYAETCHALAPGALTATDLQLHSLVASLPEQALERALDAELVEGACRLGISVSDVTSFDHRSHVLSYVPGLGPRKASALRRELQNRASQSRPVEERQSAENGLRALLGPCVWHNAVGFLHFSEEKRSVEPHLPPGLDGCRIHPEQYDQARKMCFDAKEEDDEIDETEEKLNEAVQWAMSAESMKMSEDRTSRISVLDELELEEFAEHLREENVAIGKETLEDIKAELIHPYRDTRGHCGLRGPLDADRLFTLLTSESETTLRVGCLVSVRFVRFEAGRVFGGAYNPGTMHVVLQSGLPGTIAEDCISDHWDRVPSIEGQRDGRPSQIPQLPIAEGSIISMKVLDVDRREFRVIGSCKGMDLRSATKAAEDEKSSGGVPRQQERSYTKRAISHPLFKNGTIEQVTQVLAPAPVGEVIFRPSSKGSAHLTATIKLTANGPLLHVDIAEEEKPSAGELGASLYIGRTESDQGERFDDLDEVVARFVDPLIENVREFTGHRKYLDEDTLAKVEEVLQAEKQANPLTISYRFSPMKKHASYFLLSYMPKQRLLKEYVKLTPAGFIYRKTTFASVENLLRWFKQHFNDPIPRNHP